MTLSIDEMWTKAVEDNLLALEKRPQFTLPRFPLEEFTKLYREVMHDDKAFFELESQGWLENQDLYSGLGFPLYQVEFVLEPLTTPCYLLISKQSVESLFLQTVALEEKQPFLGEQISQGFLSYLLIDLVYAFAKLHYLSYNFCLKNIDLVTEPKKLEPSFVVDAALKQPSFTLWAKFLFPKNFRDQIERHISTRPLDPQAAISQALEIELFFEAGSVALKHDDFKKIHQGDFVILDRCLIDPETLEGNVYLTLNDRPLWMGKLTKDGVELKTEPFYKESFMDQETDDLDAMEDELEPSEANNPEPLSSFSDIEVSINVVLDQIKMKAGDLLQLSPGDTIKTGSLTAKNILLVAGGKKIARGELVKLGEVLGVRITEI